MSVQKTVELHAAFMWDCDECGRENFVRAVKPSLEDLEFDNPDDATAFPLDECWMMPDSVQCIHCSAEFETCEVS